MDSVNNLVLYNRLLEVADALRIDRTAKEIDNYHLINQLYASNILKEKMTEYGIEKLLGDTFLAFMMLMNKSIYYHCKLWIYEGEFIKIFNDNSLNQMLSLYLDMPNAYKHLPLLYATCAKRFNIKVGENNYETFRENFKNFLELKFEMDWNVKKAEITTLPKKTRINEKEYERYDREGISNPDKTIAFIYGEELIFKKEIELLRRRGEENPEKYVSWLGKDHADGYGCDILSYEQQKHQERLREVKTSTSSKENITITPHELEVAKETIKIPNANYYLHTYFYKMDEYGRPDLSTFNLKTVIMDKNLGLFIDAEASAKDKTLIPYIVGRQEGFDESRIDLYTIKDYLEIDNKDRLKLIYPEEIDKLKKIGKI